MGETTLFKLFNTEEKSFSLDALKKGYYALMKKVHPDTAFSPLPLSHDKEALAGFLSQAYHRLKDPYTRSVYLYSLANNMNLTKKTFTGVEDLFHLGDTVTVLDAEKDRVGCDKKALSVEFLDTVLSLEEEIENGTSERRAELFRYLEKEIEKCQSASGTVQALVKWKYLKRLQTKLVAKDTLE